MPAMSRVKAGIATATFIGMAVTDYPVLFCSFPQLLQPVSAEFGWGRSTMPLALLIAAPIQALLYPVVGWLLDRWGSRQVLCGGFVVFGLCMVALAGMTGSVPQMLMIYVCAVLAGTFATGVAFGRVVATNFDLNRGLMLGICLGIGGGAGAAVIPGVTRLLLEHWGWRGAYVGLGLAPIFIGIPAALWLPAEVSRSKQDVADSERGRWECLQQRTFLLLVMATFSSCMVINGSAAHLAAIAADHHLTTSTAALVLSVFALAMMSGQFGIGLFLDRIQTPRLALPVFGALVLGVLQLQFATTRTTVLVGAALIGVGAGSVYGLLPYFITRFFGLRAFGFLYGVVYAAASIGTGIGPYAMGAAFDVAGSYERALVGFELVGIATVVLIAYLPRYTYAADGKQLPVLEGDGLLTAP